MANFQEVLGKGFILIIGLYAVLFTLAWADWGFFKSEITTYPLLCSHAVDLLGKCNKIDFALRTTTYKVDAKNQQVLHWVQGFEVDKLTDCAVRNRKNWTCKYENSKEEIGFNNGRFFESFDPGSLTADLASKTFYVSKHSWLKQSCQDSWIPFPVCYPFIWWLNNFSG